MGSDERRSEGRQDCFFNRRAGENHTEFLTVYGGGSGTHHGAYSASDGEKSYLDNPLQPAKGRGEDTYVQVSWEQALKLIHEQHDRIRKANGPSAIFAGSYGWRSSGVLHKAQTLLQRYMNLAGGYSGHSGDYSTGAAQVIMPHVVGSVEVYEQQTSWPLILENSQVVVLWGMNPLNTLKLPGAVPMSKGWNTSIS